VDHENGVLAGAVQLAPGLVSEGYVAQHAAELRLEAAYTVV
jgi:hypothetical protein